MSGIAWPIQLGREERRASVSADSSVYQSLQDRENRRIVSEVALKAPVTEKVNIELKLVDEYDANPADDADNNDIRFLTLLNAGF